MKSASPLTSVNTIRDAAQAYLRWGLSFIPIATDGTKGPFFELLPWVYDEDQGRYHRRWRPLCERHPTVEEVKQWYSSRIPVGLAIVAGRVSGGLEIIDCDTKEIADRFEAVVADRHPDLHRILVVVESPRGRHFYYRTEECERSQKLALEPRAYASN